MSAARSREPLERDAKGSRILTHDWVGYARGCGCKPCTEDHAAYAAGRRAAAGRRTPVGDEVRTVRVQVTLDGDHIQVRLTPAEADVLDTYARSRSGYIADLLRQRRVRTLAGLENRAARAGVTRSEYIRGVLLDALKQEEGQQR